MISGRKVEEEEYARRFEDTLHTSDSKERRESRQLLPCKYQQCRTITKPDSPGIALTRLTAAMSQRLLADVYMNITTNKADSSCKESNRMLEGGKANKLNAIITKGISRFGRNIVETSETLSQLRRLGVRVIFE